MVKEKNIYGEPETDEIHRLLGTLKRVEPPKDFDLRVRARIAKGRPAEERRSWLPVSVRYAAPLFLVVLTVTGFFGYRILTDDPARDSYVSTGPTVEVVTPAAQPSEIQRVQEPANDTLALLPSEKPTIAPERVDRKDAIKPAAQEKKNEKPGGGSYEIAAPESKVITPDVDDSAPVPANRPVLISVREFLASSGVSASAMSAGGEIRSVSGKAVAVGLQPGDVIETVNVQTGLIRVKRDGKTMSFRLR